MLPESSELPSESLPSPQIGREKDGLAPLPAQGVGLFDDDIETRQRAGLTWIVASGLILVLGVGGWLGYRTWKSRQVEPPPVITATVTRQTLEEQVNASGVVSLGNQQTLKAPGEVTVEAVLVQERQRVAQGTVLLKLRDRSLEQDLAEQLIQTDLLQLRYQRAQETLRDRQRDVQRAEERLAESKGLLDRGYIPEDEYNTDRNTLESAQSALRDAQLALQEAELEIQKNQAALANLRAKIADNAIVAPFDAVVLDIKVQDGQGLANDTALMTLGDPTREVVMFDLMPLDANKVSVNMPVRVSIIGPNPEPFTGRVISIAPQAESSSQESRDSQATVDAIAQLDRPSGTLIPGSQVNVEVVLIQRPNAVAIPVGALQQEDETPYVWIVNADHQVEKRPVVTGLTTLDAVEITSGLREGDIIIPNPPPDRPLTEGMTVVPDAPAPDPSPVPE